MAKKLTNQEIQARYSQDIAYLQGQGVDTTKITTPAYAHRRAQAIRKARVERRAVPSVREQRGKAEPKITILTKTARHLGAYQIEAKDTPSKELSLGNLARLVKIAPPPSEPYYLFIVSGVVDHTSPLDEDVGDQVERTYSYHADKPVFAEYMKRHKKTDLTYDYFHALRSDIHWLKINAISLAYPGE